MAKWLAVDAFRHLGASTNDRYAWSAQSEDGKVTVLTLWEDEIDDDGVNVSVNYFDRPGNIAKWSKQRRNATRKKHLSKVWEGDRIFRVVMVRAKDTTAMTRSTAMRWPDENLTMKLIDFDPKTGAFHAEGQRTNVKGSGWSIAELNACVLAYRKLWLAQEAGAKSNKAALRRSVVENSLSGRSEGAYERRMQNISAVVDELGLQIVEGYLPLTNIGKSKDSIIDLVNEHWNRSDQLEAPSADQDQLATRIASAARRLKRSKNPQPPGNRSVSKTTSSSTQFVRDPNVIAWVLNQADGQCEACKDPAPFERNNGTPYLEVHHIRPLAEGGPDTVDNTIASCPNCHRTLHFAKNRNEYRQMVLAQIDRLIDHPKRKLN